MSNRSAFDARADDYPRSDWHLWYAERLVALAAPVPGMRVLDAATGTGFAARAIARAVGPSGRVVGVDISAAMLAMTGSADGIEYLNADATRLDQFADESFDVVLCSAGLLYMPVRAALTEWRRLLVPGGLVGFSTMRQGSPIGGRLFREQAAAFGLSLADPAAPLGSVERCHAVMREAGFVPADVVAGTVRFSKADLDGAWEAHIRTPRYDSVNNLPAEHLADFRDRYTAALADAIDGDPDGALEADVLYAFGRKPA